MMPVLGGGNVGSVRQRCTRLSDDERYYVYEQETADPQQAIGGTMRVLEDRRGATDRCVVRWSVRLCGCEASAQRNVDQFLDEAMQCLHKRHSH